MLLVGLWLCSSLSVLAQTFPSWKITYVYSGSTTTPQNTTLTWSPTETRGYTGSRFSYDSKPSMNSSGTITATLKWSDAQGNAAPDPPKLVNIRETSYAEAAIRAVFSQTGPVTPPGGPGPAISIPIGDGSVDVNADNGMGDTATASLQNEYHLGISTGRHYSTVDGSSGFITRKVNVSASASATNSLTGTMSTKFIFTVDVLNHAHPCNMRPDPVTFVNQSVPYALTFYYVWDSTSGMNYPHIPLSDLANCQVGEILSYSGSGQNIKIGNTSYFIPQSPPFPYEEIVNPFKISFDASLGQAQDQINAPDPIQPYSNSAFTGTQYYWFHCNVCMENDEYQNLLGPFTMVRTVKFDPSTNSWIVTVTSRGYESSKFLP